MIKNSTSSAIAQAVNILHQGGLVAFPTETVYGLGADANNPLAISKIYAAKNRPANNPLIVHLGTLAEVGDWACDIPSNAWRLMQAFWPGPLTLLLKKQPNVAAALTAGLPTVALRMPAHPTALRLLQAFGRGIAAPSANKFTRISPTTAAAVAEELGDVVDFILEDQACEVGLESTILDVTQNALNIVRPGKITATAIAQCLQSDVLYNTSENIIAPGMHKLHYAPRTPTHLLAPTEIQQAALTHAANNQRVACITRTLSFTNKISQLDIFAMPLNPEAYARQLYQTLRTADNLNYHTLLIERPPQTEPWHAINDRLNKACAK